MGGSRHFDVVRPCYNARMPDDSRTPPVWILFGDCLTVLGFMVAFKVLLEGDPLLPDAAIGCVLMIIGVLIRVLIRRAR